MGWGRLWRNCPQLTEKQACVHVNCLTWDGSRVTNWASPAPALALLKWCAETKPLIWNWWRRGTGREVHLVHLGWLLWGVRCAGAPGHALLPALPAEAEHRQQQGQAPRAALAAPATSVISVWEVQIKSTSVMAVSISCAITIHESLPIIMWPFSPSLLLSQVLPKAVPCYHPHLTPGDPVMCHHWAAGWTWIPGVQSWNWMSMKLAIARLTGSLSMSHGESCDHAPGTLPGVVFVVLEIYQVSCFHHGLILLLSIFCQS